MSIHTSGQLRESNRDSVAESIKGADLSCLLRQGPLAPAVTATAAHALNSGRMLPDPAAETGLFDQGCQEVGTGGDEGDVDEEGGVAS